VSVVCVGAADVTRGRRWVVWSGGGGGGGEEEDGWVRLCEMRLAATDGVGEVWACLSPAAGRSVPKP
jgi:hypothetical protein